MNTKTVQNRICEHCNQNFTISEGEFILYDKVGMELPTLCFFCRTQHFFAFWPYGKFRKGKSDLSGANLITVLPANSRYPIYTLTEWWGDKWDAMTHGQDYDPARPFFDQLRDLQEKIPRPHQTGSKNTGCDWCEDVWQSKNCHLSRCMLDCEDLFYSYRNLKVKNSIDVVVCFDSEKCFDCGDCHNSYKLFYSRHSRDCVDSYFLYDCRNCQNCFMSWNLRNKRYCILNEQYTKEEYEEKIKSIFFGSFEVIQNLRKQFAGIIKNEVVHRPNFNFRTYDSDGDYLENTKNCHRSFTISDSEDCYNCVRGMTQKSNIDVVGSFNVELSGSCVICQPSGYGLKNSLYSPSRYSEYLDLCVECEYCFGCVGLKKKKYCILNKQCTKDEYETLKNKIIADMKNRGEYGKFFPYKMSPTAFNFSNSAFYFPEAKKEDILRLGGYWEDINESHIEGMPTSELPDDIKDAPDSIATQALVCPETGWRFNVTKDELVFYRENNIPLPRYHFDVRIRNSLKYLTIIQSYPYRCFYCKKDISAFYRPEWNYQKIACEECYKQNIA